LKLQPSKGKGKGKGKRKEIATQLRQIVGFEIFNTRQNVVFVEQAKDLEEKNMNSTPKKNPDSYF